MFDKTGIMLGNLLVNPEDIAEEPRKGPVSVIDFLGKSPPLGGKAHIAVSLHGHVPVLSTDMARDTLGLLTPRCLAMSVLRTLSLSFLISRTRIASK